MQSVIKQYPIYCALCRFFYFYFLNHCDLLWYPVSEVSYFSWTECDVFRKKALLLFYSRGIRMVLTSSQLSRWYMCCVRDCTLWHAAQSRLISMRQAHRRKMRGSDAEREARRKRQCNIRLEGVKINEINLIYSFFLPQKLAYPFGGLSICATSL